MQRYDGYFSVILCDIDHFKDINDRYGHHVGDEALKSFCGTISANLRAVDVMARWGGEEFVILAPGIRLQEAVNLAEKLRQLTQERVLVSETARRCPPSATPGPMCAPGADPHKRYAARLSLGDLPVQRLKALEKLAGSEYPSR